jgi:glycerophosphoryl diester phosphodiesterase
MWSLQPPRPRRAPLLLTLALVASGCGDASDAPDAGARDAGTAEGLPLPPASAYLDPARYDCRAGVVQAPTRPHPVTCFRDPECRSRLLVAHRIAKPFAPENSLSALRAAILLGVDIVETDVRSTADGALVLLHDQSLDRTVTATGAVGNYTLRELRRRPMRVPDYLQGDFSCDRVPTLDEVFAVAAGQIVVELEVKERQAGIAAASYLKERGLYDSAFLLCDFSECDAVRAAVPDAPLMVRARGPDDVAQALGYAPLMVHIDPSSNFLSDAVVQQIRAGRAKVFSNGFTLGDPQAALVHSLDGYLELYERGLDVQQVENPHWALTALGRLERPATP